MPATLRRTALFDAHVRQGARMVPFADWEMPVQYQGIVAEHLAVRSSWGTFDVSHMGRIWLSGPGAAPLLDHLLTGGVATLAEGRARYSLLCLEDGGILDDVVAVRLAPDRLLLVCNAANRAAVGDWLRTHAPAFAPCDIADRTLDTVMVAVQGPQGGLRLDVLLGQPVTTLKRFGATEVGWRGAPMLVTRTGYTGEDGFEAIAPSEAGGALWRALLEAGATPCGLGARDTLRLEAGLLLHGNDIGRAVNPLEAGLERFIRLDSGAYIGKEALLRARERGLARRLAGFRSRERGAVPRKGHAILDRGRPVGQVTSGSYSPTLEANIGLGFVPPPLAQPGISLNVTVRQAFVPIETVALPFYKRTAS